MTLSKPESRLLVYHHQNYFLKEFSPRESEKLHFGGVLMKSLLGKSRVVGHSQFHGLSLL